jgi:hypothetical protein
MAAAEKRKTAAEKLQALGFHGRSIAGGEVPGVSFTHDDCSVFPAVPTACSMEG